MHIKNKTLNFAAKQIKEYVIRKKTFCNSKNYCETLSRCILQESHLKDANGKSSELEILFDRKISFCFSYLFPNWLLTVPGILYVVKAKGFKRVFESHRVQELKKITYI